MILMILNKKNIIKILHVLDFSNLLVICNCNIKLLAKYQVFLYIIYIYIYIYNEPKKK
jgi:hypothetical protein